VGGTAVRSCKHPEPLPIQSFPKTIAHSRI
jgi:hypothetical protein